MKELAGGIPPIFGETSRVSPSVRGAIPHYANRLTYTTPRLRKYFALPGRMKSRYTKVKNMHCSNPPATVYLQNVVNSDRAAPSVRVGLCQTQEAAANGGALLFLEEQAAPNPKHRLFHSWTD